MQYSCVHEISVRDPSKNGSRPLWGCIPQVENHWHKGFNERSNSFDHATILYLKTCFAFALHLY